MKTNCFGFKSNTECTCLNKLYCASGRKCGFFKTPEQYKHDAKRALERITDMGKSVVMVEGEEYNYITLK